MDDIRRPKFKTFKVKFSKTGESHRIAKEKLFFAEINHEKNRVKVTADDKDIKGLMAILLNYEIEYVSEMKLTLEGHFMKFYSTNNQGGIR